MQCLQCSYLLALQQQSMVVFVGDALPPCLLLSSQPFCPRSLARCVRRRTRVAPGGAAVRALGCAMADQEAKAQRVRSLLSAYYTAGADGGAPGQTRSAASIDSAAFDTEAYISNLARALRARARASLFTPLAAQLKKTRLDQLHNKYASMTSEIRALDSDMQARRAGVAPAP